MPELSPEEKQRIYAEEKTRIEAQERVKKDLEAKKKRKWKIGCLTLLGLWIFVIIMSQQGKYKTQSPSSSLEKKYVSKDELIKRFKERGWDELSKLGVETLKYRDNDLLIYVREFRWNGLTEMQKEELIKILTKEWSKAVGTTKYDIKIIDYETNKELETWK